MCCMQLAKNSECKNSPSAHHCTTSSGYIFARHVSTIGKKLLKQQYHLHMSLQYNELLPTNGRDRWQVWGTPSKFQRVSHLCFVTAPMSLNQTLHDIWPSPGLVQHIYIFRGLFPPNGILPGAKFTLLPSLASPVLTALLHSTRTVDVSQTLWRGTRKGITEISLLICANYIFRSAAITLGISPHSSIINNHQL